MLQSSVGVWWCQTVSVGVRLLLGSLSSNVRDFDFFWAEITVQVGYSMVQLGLVFLEYQHLVSSTCQASVIQQFLIGIDFFAQLGCSV